ncbi:MAG TPA: ATP-binding protein [Blastocatellia bacterium]|nr:ATP-binding protein [Blastocatellia bacterium]
MTDTNKYVLTAHTHKGEIGNHYERDSALDPEHYRIVALTASDAIISIDQHSVILYVNPAAEKIFGHTAEEMLGQSLTMLMPEYLRHLHRAGLNRYLQTGERHISWQGVELPGLHKSGAEIPLEVSFGEFVRGGQHFFTGVIRDITQRKRAGSRLAAQHAVARILAESARINEAAHQILQAICECLNWDVGALWLVDEGHELLRCIDTWHAANVEVAEFEAASLQRTFSRGEGLPGRVWAMGHPLWLMNIQADDNFPRAPIAAKVGLHGAFSFPILLGGEVFGVMEFFAREAKDPDNDLTAMMAAIGSQVGQFIERRQAEQERDQLLIREQAARAEAEAANRLKDEFLATISHELRTPLTAILGWARMLRTGNLDQGASAQAVEVIERNAKLQAQLIDDLLDVSRIITGKLLLETQPVDLPAIIQAALDTVRPAADAKQINIETAIDPAAGPVAGDRNRLQQVVWNLLSNSIKFTPHGGRIEVHLERADSQVEIRVSDTGKGIAPEFLPYVFDRFRQADTSFTRSSGGLGLGLAIVRHLVEMHGGAVHAESAGEGQGATFTVSLPLLVGRVMPVEAPGAQAALSNDCLPELEGLRVLVVDDEPDTLELIRRLLSGCGAEVRTASSAVEALEELDSWGAEIMVADIGMPGEDGYSLIAKLRAREAERGGRIPAIALTAFARSEDRIRSLTAGYQVHLAKPVDLTELAMMIASLSGRTGRVDEKH